MRLSAEQSRKVQTFKGLAILAVVVVHNMPMGLPHVFLRPFMNFCVGLFLFFSGMLSTASRWKPWKRLIKVLIPYILWSLIYTVLQNIHSPGSIPMAFVKSTLLGNSAVIMYYIFLYCELTLLVPLIDRLARSRFRYWGFAVAPLEILLMRTVPMLAGRPFGGYLELIMGISCLGWFSYYYLGYMLGNDLIRVKPSPGKITGLWLLSIPLQMAEGYYYYIQGYENCGTQLKLSALLTGVLFAVMVYNYLRSGRERRVKVLEFLGDHSFGIYFSHLAVRQFLLMVPGYVGHVSWPVAGIVNIAATALLVLAARKILGKYSRYLAF
ncbi:MAG: acyltransferase [Bacteroidales bacterium]|nr:acyltransferase [Bacteroidales bacterium]